MKSKDQTNSGIWFADENYAYQKDSTIQVINFTLLIPQQLIALTNRIDQHLLCLNELLHEHCVI